MEPTKKISYSAPPVVETVLGVQFDRMPRLRNAHLGAFWKTLDGHEWPTIADVPPLPSQFERFTESARWAAQLQLELTNDPSSRLQIRNQAENRMIQIQNGRIHFNWLKNAVVYPRYEEVRDEFAVVLQKFESFVEDEDLGVVCPNQWEVTYVNQIQRGTVWNTLQDWSFFKPLGALPTIPRLIEAESFGGEWHFLIPQHRGRLHVAWEHGSGEGDSENADFVRITLTARGEIPGKDRTQVLPGLELGRDTVVRSFCSLMSDAANDFWGLKR